MNTRKTGAGAEDAALKYIVANGLELVERNYTTPYGEADIIAKEGSVFVFIEVKARRNQKYGSPADAVTKRKKLRYLNIAQYYFMSKSIRDYEVRFDVAEVYISGGKFNVNYIKNAFDFTGISDFY